MSCSVQFFVRLQGAFQALPGGAKTKNERRAVIERLFGDGWEERYMAVMDELLASSLGEEDLMDSFLAKRRDFPFLIEVIHNLCGPLRMAILLFPQDWDWATTRYVKRAPGVDGKTPLCV